MMLQAAVLLAAQLLSPAAEAFVAESTGRLLAGEELAPDFPVRLQSLAPDQRLLVIAYLRRAGYLADLAMPIDWVIGPAAPDPAVPPASGAGH